MTTKQKLELTWIGKENRPRLEPRILLEDPSKSYHAEHRVTKNDIFDNRLIFGDNLLALKALEQDYAGKVKCIFIDPPYNTGNAFKDYDDGVEHSLWLGLMRDRLEIIKYLLSNDGSLWISIDDDECHYLKVLCDEIFGRNNFVNNVIWEKKFSPQNDAKWLSDNHDHILVYAKSKDIWRPDLLPRTQEMDARYKNPDNDPRGVWTSGDLLRKDIQKSGLYTITTPSGKQYNPPSGRSWRMPEYSFMEAVKDNRIWFGFNGSNVPRIKRFLSEVQPGVKAMTIWFREDVGDNDTAAKEIRKLFPNDPFSTPKPERLIERILSLSTKPGDLVLDSFAGSGTTGAVAHKMGRRWIMIELGEHCHTHIIPRLKKVIDGEDLGGISVSQKIQKSKIELCDECLDSLCEECSSKYSNKNTKSQVLWKGGGGFRYYKVAPSLLQKDKWGNWIINKEYNAAMLAEAVCKLEGFTYLPSDSLYWMHGKSTETDFIYVTTQNLSRDQLSLLSDEVGSDRTLLVMCSAFRAKAEDFPNLTIKKIPNSVLSKCEWAHDDYSLQVENLPSAPKPVKSQMDLFDGEDE